MTGALIDIAKDIDAVAHSLASGVDYKTNIACAFELGMIFSDLMHVIDNLPKELD